jgi:hypothetical protein
VRQNPPVKRPLIIVAVLALLLLAFLANRVVYSPPTWGAPPSVALLGVATNLSGERLALLCFTNASSAEVIGSAYFVDYKVEDAWVIHPSLPAAIRASIPSVLALGPRESRLVRVPFPTNTTWRFRVLYQEKDRGLAGQFYRAADFVSNLFRSTTVTSYNGQRYSAQTPEIAN